MTIFRIIATTFLFVSASLAQAAQSDWFETDGAKIRLISLPSPDGASIKAGLEIQLEPGWKTYWRSPGASGLPPQLDFSRSKNVASTKLNFPAPIAFGDKGNLTAGYTDQVVFPIAVEPLFANRPVAINVDGLVGICGEVCVPVQFQLGVTEDGKGISSREVASALLSASLKLVDPATESFGVEEARVVGDSLNVKAVVPAGSTHLTLFVEGPSNWYLTPALSKSVSGDVAHFSVSLSDIPADRALENTPMTFTLVADGKGVEQTMTPKK